MCSCESGDSERDSEPRLSIVVVIARQNPPRVIGNSDRKLVIGNLFFMNVGVAKWGRGFPRHFSTLLSVGVVACNTPPTRGSSIRARGRLARADAWGSVRFLRQRV